jgi:hypothetical protein
VIAPDRLKVETLKAAWAEDRLARVEHWRRHWPVELLDALWGLGGGFVFGVALGLAAVVSALVELAK